MFRQIKNQARAVNILQKAVAEKKAAQAYLFYGPAGCGKFMAAQYFAMALNCAAYSDYKPCGVCPSCKKFLQLTHPDFLYVFPTPNLEISPEGEFKNEAKLGEYTDFVKNRINEPWKKSFFSSKAEIRIDIIRHLQHRINLSLNEALKRVYIIEDADKMNVKAANAFLKTLEEPPADTVLILTTTKPQAILPTILSRCQKLQFMPLSSATIYEQLVSKFSIEDNTAKVAAKVANGNLEKAIELCLKDETRKNAKTLLSLAKTKNDIEFLDFANAFTGAKNRQILFELLSYLVIWITDVTLLTNNPNLIANLDEINFLKQIYTLQFEHKANDLCEQIEINQKKIDGNIDTFLILTDVYNKLKNAF